MTTLTAIPVVHYTSDYQDREGKIFVSCTNEVFYENVEGQVQTTLDELPNLPLHDRIYYVRETNTLDDLKPIKLILMKDAFNSRFDIGVGVGTHKWVKRMSRVFAPNNNLNEFVILKCDQVDIGTILKIQHKKSGSIIRIGIFDYNKLDIVNGDYLSLDGSMRATRTFSDLFPSVDMRIGDAANITGVHSGGMYKGHVHIVPRHILPFNVDLELLDPKPELSLISDGEILLGINSKCHRSRVSLDLESVINFFDKSSKILLGYAKKALFSISEKIPINPDQKDMDKYIQSMSQYDPILAKCVQVLAGRRIKITRPWMISSTANIINHAISFIAGRKNRASRIPIGGESCVLSLKPCVFHKKDLFSGFKEHVDHNNRIVYLVVSGIKEITRAMIYRIPNNRGDFAEAILIPSKMIKEYEWLPDTASVGYVDREDIKYLFERCGGGDGDDHFQIIPESTHPKLFKSFNRTEKNQNFVLKIDGKPHQLDVRNMSGSIKSYIETIYKLTWNIGMVSNSVMMAQIMLDYHKTIKPILSKAEIDICYSVSHLPLSDILDAEKSGVFDKSMVEIGNILQRFSQIKHAPILFCPGLAGGNDDRSKWIRKLLNKRLKYRTITKGKSPIYDNLSMMYLDIIRIAHAVNNKVALLSWYSLRDTQAAIVDQLGNLIHKTISLKELVVRKDKSFVGKFADTDNEVMSLNRTLQLWRLGIEMKKSHRFTFQWWDERVQANLKYCSDVKRRTTHYNDILEHILENTDFPHLRDVIRILLIPTVKEMKSVWGLNNLSDTQVLKRLRLESMVVQYMDRGKSSNKKYITEKSSWSTGIPSREIFNLEHKVRYYIYKQNTIVRFNDTICGMFFKMNVALDSSDGSLDALEHTTKDAGMFRTLFLDHELEVPVQSLLDALFGAIGENNKTAAEVTE